MKNFTKSVEKKIGEVENFITNLSVNNHRVGTPEREEESEREYCGIIKIKSRVSTLEKTTGWEGCYYRFPSESKGSGWNR